MKFVRIGDRVLNVSVIQEVVDEGEVETMKGKERVVKLILAEKKFLRFAGAEAEAILAAVARETEVWLESHTPPEFPVAFGSR